MKFTIPRENFVAGLQTVSRAVSSSAVVPALSGILIAAEDGELRLVGSNSSLSIEATVTAQVEQEGSIVLPAKHLVDIIKKMPAGEINVEMQIIPVTCTFKAASKKSEFVLHGIKAEDYPNVKFDSSETPTNIRQSDLHYMIRSTVFAAAQSDNRPILTGELLERKAGTTTLVGIDGVRLALARINNSDDADALPAVVPASTLSEILRLLDAKDDSEILLTIDQSHLHLDLGKVRVVSRLLEGQFPPYAQIIPEKSKTVVTLKRVEFAEACERASLLSGDNDKTIRIVANEGAMVISAKTAEVGSAREVLECEVEGDKFDVAFNSRFITDGLKEMSSEKVSLYANGPFSPVKFTPVGSDGYVYVAMPLRTLGE